METVFYIINNLDSKKNTSIDHAIHDFVYISKWVISNSTEILPNIKQFKNAQY